MGLSGDLPEFPSPNTPATHEQVNSFLLKARALGWPNLIMVHSQDTVTAVCLLQEIHVKDSLHHLPMENKVEAGGKPIQKLSFCPFCQYSGSNNPSYMNHIICRHYNANYGCGKCLDEVYITGQLLCKHMKTCEDLPKEAADKATTEDTDGATSGKKKKKGKSKDLPPDSQPPSQSSQASPHHSQHTKEKANTMPKKSGSSSKSSHKRRSTPPATNTMASQARTRTSPASAVQQSPVGPARTSAARQAKTSPVITTKPSPAEPAKTSLPRKIRTSPASTTGKAKLAKRSKVASPDMGVHLPHPIPVPVD